MDIQILHHDKDIVVCIKPVGVSSENTEKGDGLPDLLGSQLGEKYVATLHRLDVGVGGVMAYALNPKSAAFLSREITEGRFDKRYFARVYGTPEEKSGIFEDLLFKDSKKNKSFVVKKQRAGVKKAKLSYEVLESDEKTSLVDILLYTGRSHQIRVQFSSRGMPLVGDGKYGAKDNEKSIALMCHALEFVHPTSREKLKFDIPCTI
ncbi:MAG: RluA family pseudouridine synthase [Clostridia bacterium]|nr:RluA family pseudouridine synthase [Clostridia bacterium]